MRCLRIVVIFCFLCFGLAGCLSDSHLSAVKFKIVEFDTGNPLKDCHLDIYRFAYDVHFESKETDLYITSVTTDSQGVFSLDLSKINVSYTVVQPGKQYGIVRFERSSDLSHTKSTDHIRIVGSTPGKISFAGNAIYDLKRRVVKIVPFSGATEKEPYTKILLVVRKYKVLNSGK